MDIALNLKREMRGYQTKQKNLSRTSTFFKTLPKINRYLRAGRRQRASDPSPSAKIRRNFERIQLFQYGRSWVAHAGVGETTQTSRPKSASAQVHSKIQEQSPTMEGFKRKELYGLYEVTDHHCNKDIFQMKKIE